MAWKPFGKILEFVWMDRKGHRAGRWLSSEWSDDPSGGSKLVNVDYVFHIRHKFLLRFHQFLDDGPAWKTKTQKTFIVTNKELEIANYFSYLLSFGYGIKGDELASWTSPSVSAFTFRWFFFFRRGFDLLDDVSFHLNVALLLVSFHGVVISWIAFPLTRFRTSFALRSNGHLVLGCAIVQQSRRSFILSNSQIQVAKNKWKWPFLAKTKKLK